MKSSFINKTSKYKNIRSHINTLHYPVVYHTVCGALLYIVYSVLQPHEEDPKPTNVPITHATKGDAECSLLL